MMNEIISSIPFEKYKNKNKFVKFWTNNEEFVDVIGTSIRICLTKDDCEKLYDKWYLNDFPYIKKEEANEWMTTRIVGSITKFKLDRQRNNEINESDILQNTSIVYHTESLVEMQIMCLTIFSIYGVNRYKIEADTATSDEKFKDF